MLTLIIPEQELFDDNTQMFIHVKSQTLQLEHSLVSISKWESRWHKILLHEYKDPSKAQTKEELLDYIKCMTITQNVNPLVYYGINNDLMTKITDYIADPMSGSYITIPNKNNQTKNKEPMSSELIYYLMIQYGIPFECQKWHINRLLKLIQICQIKNAPTSSKKLSTAQMARNNAENMARRAMLHSKG